MPALVVFVPQSLALVLLAVLAWAAAAQPQLPPAALANTYHDAVDLARYWASEKLDGVRARWDGEALYSRRGNRFSAPPSFLRGFPDQALDGELWLGRGRFEELSGIVRRKAPKQESWRDIRYMVFDLPLCAGAFDERWRQLQAMFEIVDAPHLGLVEQFRVANRGELMAALNATIAGGGEGLMLRRGSSLHRGGRSDDLLKLKPHEDAEAVVIAHLPGQGKYAGMTGSLLVETPEGLQFKLGTGFSDAERRQPPPIGSTVTYKYHGKTNKGIPRFASFLRLRAPL